MLDIDQHFFGCEQDASLEVLELQKNDMIRQYTPPSDHHLGVLSCSELISTDELGDTHAHLVECEPHSDAQSRTAAEREERVRIVGGIEEALGSELIRVREELRVSVDDVRREFDGCAPRDSYA